MKTARKRPKATGRIVLIRDGRLKDGKARAG